VANEFRSAASETPPHGAERIDDEIEVGYDQGFETRWASVVGVGRSLILLVVVAAATGLFGRGPLSHRTVYSPRASLAVDFEPVARYDTSTLVTIHYTLPPGGPDTTDAARPIRLHVSDQVAEPMGLQTLWPAPLDSQSVAPDLVFTYEVPRGVRVGLVRLALKPSEVGPQHLTASLDGDTASWTQWVAP
jgi:hypothetical protein